MAERALYLKFYAAMKKYSQAEEWGKFLRISDRFYEVLYKDCQQSQDASERNALCKKMEDLILLSQMADWERERNEEKEDNPYEIITHSIIKMQEAFLNRNWDLALSWNDRAYNKSYELYEQSEGKTKANLAQRLASLHSCQDLILTQQLGEKRK